MATATANTDAVILRSAPVRKTLVPTEVFKDWARSNGLTVTEGRGRVSNEAIDAYNLDPANRRAGRQYLPGEGKPAPVSEYTYNYLDGRGRARQGTFQAAPGTVRQWANGNGHPVPAKGRIPQSALDAFGQAHRAAPRTRKPRAAASE